MDNTIISALISVVGTLLGAILGFYVTYKLQKQNEQKSFLLIKISKYEEIDVTISHLMNYLHTSKLGLEQLIYCSKDKDIDRSKLDKIRESLVLAGEKNEELQIKLNTHMSFYATQFTTLFNATKVGYISYITYFNSIIYSKEIDQKKYDKLCSQYKTAIENMSNFKNKLNEEVSSYFS